jgi:hypothetical protein
MGVFKLTPSNQETTEPLTETDQETTAGTLVSYTNKTNEELQEESANQLKAKQEKKITLDGPLSKIYTAALNLAFAKETMVEDEVILLTDSNQTDNRSKEDVSDQENTYVYCCDGNELNRSNLVEGVDKLRVALDSGKFKNVALSIECSKNITSNIGLFEEYAKQLNVTVYHNRKQALESISRSIKGHI